MNSFEALKLIELADEVKKLQDRRLELRRLFEYLDRNQTEGRAERLYFKSNVAGITCMEREWPEACSSLLKKTALDWLLEELAKVDRTLSEMTPGVSSSCPS